MAWALLGVRIVVGGVFLYAGAAKLADPAAFAEAIARYRLTPDWLNVPLARFLPWVELLAGISLATGTLARGGAGIAGGLSAMFAVAIAAALVRGLDIHCGCFGSTGGPVSWQHVTRNLVTLSACVAVFVSGMMFESTPAVVPKLNTILPCASSVPEEPITAVVASSEKFQGMSVAEAVVAALAQDNSTSDPRATWTVTTGVCPAWVV